MSQDMLRAELVVVAGGVLMLGLVLWIYVLLRHLRTHARAIAKLTRESQCTRRKTQTSLEKPQSK